MNRMLGKLPAIFPSNAPRMDGQKLMARQAPPKLIRDHIDPGPQMDDNDNIGDCVPVAIANIARARARLDGYTLTIPTAKTVGFYSQVTGYDPSNPKSDGGTDEASACTALARDGFDIGQQERLYALWGSIDHQDLNGLRLVCSEINPPLLGVGLALADQALGVWDTTTAGDQTPNSWGGHGVGLWDYDGIELDSLVTIITWGSVKQKATWRWLLARMDEAHALSFRQLRKADVLGVNYDTWEADCSSYLQSA
ncbi:MAG: hypothetical protein ACRYGR_09920 [Janthinobacterium lividum]